MRETASSFTLTETGSLHENTHETGNTVEGTYARTITPTDSYTMVETGTTSLGAFTETITGNDTDTLTETGNPATETFTRTIVVSGSYTRTETGIGATLGSGSGTIGGTITETGNTLGAVFSQTTIADRYSLLEHSVNVANTGSGNTPGNMNYLPFGQPFKDPTFSVGYGVDLSFFVGHLCGSIDLNFGYDLNGNNGFTMGISTTSGLGLGPGFGGAAGFRGTFTSADTVADLEGDSHQAGFWAAAPVDFGVTLIKGRNYGGFTISGLGPGFGGGLFAGRTHTKQIRLV